MPTRLTTGIKTLDEALEGGIPRGSWVVIAGEPGTGKTLLSLHFAAAGLAAGDYVVYVTTEQEFNDIIEQARTIGLDLAKYPRYAYLPGHPPSKQPQLVIIDLFSLWKKAIQMTKEQSQQERKKYYTPLDIGTLHAALKDVFNIFNPGKNDNIRLIIDSMSAFWVDKPALARKMSYELKLRIHRPNITTYMTSQYATSTQSTFGFGIEHVADGVLHLWMDSVERVKEIRRYLIIKKMRMTNHAKTAFILDVEPGKGVILTPYKRRQ